MTIQIVILAAGSGTRMHSAMPKVMHHIGGKTLLEHVIQKSLSLATLPPPIVIHGHQGKSVQDYHAAYSVQWIEQKEQLGTAHALLQALPAIRAADRVLVLYGDMPLITLKTLNQLIQTTNDHAIGIVTANLSCPTHYGRIKRDSKNHIIGIVEEKDATESEQAITEINAGIYLIPCELLKKYLSCIQNNNQQGEYYLPDIIGFATKDHIEIHAVISEKTDEVLGINTRNQLAHLERLYQREQADKLMAQGVTLFDPNRLDIRGDIQIAPDVTIDVNVILEGRVVIGQNSIIGPHVILRNTTLADHVHVRAHSIIDGANVACGCIIGPFARIRPETTLKDNVHIGNFVEVKQSTIEASSKINHLSYIGDCEMGQRVNVGAGTITCNYDGANKHKTIIENDVHIGSDTQLVAPLIVKEGTTIGAGSTVTHSTPPNELTITHVLKQRTVPSWKRPKRITRN
ncbi:MAG: UDP-N-acetylglucosamine diphosphorylase/glucosamine-1-phosphate N-acetyltransferase [Gammaproteobacteria bacterium RIFCSPHIGHO2_12_FULL_42_10]|nr:MAG: UDP-N-acetylglucosamine diphosphorylase/glucosamine-1-phosphate N-acetyltransferase [Gammaproteobacteria bacterium RIFCSPHIGHO2_12_FULL_42_10]